NTARSSVLASSAQMSVVSRNTAGANDPSYSRKIGSLVAGSGTARVVVSRASDAVLLDRMLSATSDSATQKAVLDGLNKLDQTVGDSDAAQSVGAKISALEAALQQYANKPDDP